MRKVPSIILLSAVVPALSALPVIAPPAAKPQPVTPEVRAVVVGGVDDASLRTAAGAESKEASAEARAELQASDQRGDPPARPAVFTKASDAADFELLGVTWRAGSTADLTVLVRTHNDDGWTDWTALDPAPTPDRAEGDVLRAGTEPLYAGPSNGYQVRIDVRDGVLPDDVRVDLIDPGESRADASVGDRVPAASAAAVSSQPRIFTRKEWGADERLRGGSPNYTSTIKAGFVHHTAGANGYAAADVPRILRGIYAYHTKSNGWSDVGYNFLVDRFGRIWEGRYGGITRPVLGAHTGGFNTDTFAVSAIGNFDKAGAPVAMTDAIAKVLAWKLSLHYRNPSGTTTLTSSGGGTSRYAAGKKVTINVISAHRNMGYTSCPGKNLYAKMTTIRSKVKAYMGAALVSPAASVASRPYGGTPLVVTAGVLTGQSWRLEIRERCRGTLVRRLSGTASTGAPISASWNLRNSDGSLTRPGSYDLALSSWSGSNAARSWTRGFSVTSADGSQPAQAPIALPGESPYVAVNPARLYDSRVGGKLPLGPGARLDLKVTGVGGLPSTGVAAVALNVTATCPTSSTYLTIWPTGGTKPTVSSLNLTAGATRAAFTVSAVGATGKVSFANASGATDVVVDVVGYYPTTPSAGTLFHPSQPFRLYDSRTGTAGTMAGGQSRTIQMPALGGTAPELMTAAVLNVTAVGAAGSGYLTVYPAGTTRPRTSTVNFSTPSAVPNRTVTRLSDGRFKITNSGSATHVVVDVVGWYAAPSVAGGDEYQAVAPSRVLDTRLGLGARKGPVPAAGVIGLVVAGTGKRVPIDASAVVMTLTSTRATKPTYMTVWPTGTTRPSSSDLNVDAGQTAANLVIVPIGTGGRLSLYNYGGSAHLVGDVVGYYR